MSEQQSMIANLDGTAVGSFWLALLSVVLRIWCRKTAGVKLWWDDWMMIAAAVAIIASHLLYMISLRNYLGHHLYTLELGAFVPFLRTVYWQSILYVVDITLIKLSIILFYWRIFAITARKSIIFLAVVTLVWAAVSIGFYSFQCNPISFFWTRAGTATCLDPRKIVIGVSCPNIITDFALTLLPLPHVFRLKLRFGQRLLLGMIFMLGFFVILVSILRLVAFAQTDLYNPDVTWNLSEGLKWTVVELMTGLLCANLPTMRPVVTRLRKAVPARISSLFASARSGGSRQSKSQASSNPYQQASIPRDPNKSFAQYQNPGNMGNPLELTNMGPSPTESRHELNRTSREYSRENIEEDVGDDGVGMSDQAVGYGQRDLESVGDHPTTTTTNLLERPEPVHLNAINVQTSYTVQYEDQRPGVERTTFGNQ